MKNKGCLLVRPPMLNAKSSEILFKNLPNFGLLGGLVVMGYKNYRLLVQKAHPCVNPHHLSHFAWRSVGGLTTRCTPDKSQKVTLSPLTQGLNYRSACDNSRGGLTTLRALGFTIIVNPSQKLVLGWYKTLILVVE